MHLIVELFSTESLPSEDSTPSSTVPSATSLPSTPSTVSRQQMLSGMTPPANSESLDPTYLLLWPQPQQITQIKGTRFFPTSSLHVVVFRGLQTGMENHTNKIFFKLFKIIKNAFGLDKKNR